MFDKAQARKLCEDISLCRHLPTLDLRPQARKELHTLAWMAQELFPSFQSERIHFCPPPGWRQHNHSITRFGDRLLTALRATHCIIDDRGPRIIEGTPNFSRTFLLDIDPDSLRDRLVHELFLPEPPTERLPGVISGFEDLRLFSRGKELWGIFVRCDQNEEAWPEQWVGRIVGDTIESSRRLKSPEVRRPEKNWMPAVINDQEIWFVYSCDPLLLLDETGKPQARSEPPIAADHLRGSSQLVQLKDGGHLAIVHSSTLSRGWPIYSFRFVSFDRGRLGGISDTFRFPDDFSEPYLHGFQYAMGLCWHPDNERLLISYQVGDGQSRLGVVRAADVTNALRGL
jgi:hypothetical protein